MKILVFNGSPKKVKSDTMTRAFLDGMDAEFITLMEENIEREPLRRSICAKVKHPGAAARRACLRDTTSAS